MGKLKQVISQLRKIDVQKIVERQIVKNEDEVVDLNTENQLRQGLDSQGKEMPDYSPASVEIFGKPSGAMTYFDEGDFYREFYLETKKFPFLVDSKDWKRDMLVEKAQENGNDIFGFTKDSKKQINEIILEDVQKDFKSEVTKAFKVLS